MTIAGDGETLELTKSDFAEINTAFDSRLDEHVVFFKLSDDKSIEFSKFTYAQTNKTIDISVCGEVIISPKIISAIYGGNGRLSNLGSEEKANRIAKQLNTGKCN